MRIHYWQNVFNSEGNPVVGASIYVYLAGTNTPAYVYKDENANDYSNVVPQIVTDENGFFEFWIGDTSESYGYDSTQKFRIRWEHSSITAGEVDYEDVFPLVFPVDENDADEQKNKCVSNLLANQWTMHIQNTSANPHSQYINKNGSVQLTADWDTGIYKILGATFQARDSRGISILNTSNLGLVIDESGLTSVHSLNVSSNFSLNGIEISTTASELNNLAGRGMGVDSNGAIVVTNTSQTLSNKIILYPKVNSSSNLIATSEELNQLHGVNLAELVAGDTQTLVRIDAPKINEDVATYITSSELNALHGKVIGGSAAGDITDNSSTQTLSNKKLTSVKINDDVVLTTTGTELNQLHNKSLVFTTGAQTITDKTFLYPIISDFTNAQHSHNNTSNGGQISHANLLNLSADDHPLYAKKASNETISGTWSFSNVITGQTPTTGSHLTTKDYVDNKLSSLGGAGIYYVSVSATDQSNSSTVNSLAYLISLIGSNKATIIFYGNTTYNIVNNSMTIPSNITLYFYEGAIFNISFGKTLTINGKIISQPQQLFSGSGTVAGTLTGMKTFYPQWFGFSESATGSTNATAIKNLISIISAGSEIIILPGIYQINGPISITKQINFIGSSLYHCKLIEQSVDATMFIINTTDAVIFKNLRISGRKDITRTGTCFSVGPTYGTQNGWSEFDACLIEDHGIGFDFQNAWFWRITNCYVVGSTNIGIKCANLTTYDEGGGLIFNCVIDTGASSAVAGIYYSSGGGLRISKCVIMNTQYGIWCNFDPSGMLTSDLIISDNFIENVNVACIQINLTSGAGFESIQIANNEFLAIGDAINIDGAIATVTISNNVLRLFNSGHNCIKINSGSDMIISGNICDGMNNSSTIGINNAGGTNIIQSTNLFKRITTATSGSFA